MFHFYCLLQLFFNFSRYPHFTFLSESNVLVFLTRAVIIFACCLVQFLLFSNLHSPPISVISVKASSISLIRRIYDSISDRKCSFRGKFHSFEKCSEKIFFQKRNSSLAKIISEMCTLKFQQRVARSASARTG